MQDCMPTAERLMIAMRRQDVDLCLAKQAIRRRREGFHGVAIVFIWHPAVWLRLHGKGSKGET